MRPEIIFSILAIMFICIAGAFGGLDPKDGSTGEIQYTNGQSLTCVFKDGHCAPDPDQFYAMATAHPFPTPTPTLAPQKHDHNDSVYLLPMFWALMMTSR